MSCKSSNKKRPMAEINVVPYIDVMLVLLVIFMITAPLLMQGVAVDLPNTQANAIESKQKEPIIISIDAKGQYYLNVSNHPEQPLNSNILVNRILAEWALDKQQGVTRPLLIKGDKHVDYGTVVWMMALLQQSGIEHVGLITQPANNNNGPQP